AVGAVVLAHRAPLALAEVWAPFAPRRAVQERRAQPRRLHVVHHPGRGCNSRSPRDWREERPATGRFTGSGETVTGYRCARGCVASLLRDRCWHTSCVSAGMAVDGDD